MVAGISTSFFFHSWVIAVDMSHRADVPQCVDMPRFVYSVIVDGNWVVSTFGCF